MRVAGMSVEDSIDQSNHTQLVMPRLGACRGRTAATRSSFARPRLRTALPQAVSSCTLRTASLGRRAFASPR